MSQIDEILDIVYGAGVYVTEQRINNNPTGTVTSDRLLEAKDKLKSLLLSEAVDCIDIYAHSDKAKVRAIPIEAINKLFGDEE